MLHPYLYNMYYLLNTIKSIRSAIAGEFLFTDLVSD